MHTLDVGLLCIPSVKIEDRHGGKRSLTFDSSVDGIEGATTLYVEHAGDAMVGVTRVARDAVLGVSLPDLTPLFVVVPHDQMYGASPSFIKQLMDTNDDDDPLFMGIAVAMMKHAATNGSDSISKSMMQDGDSTEYDTTYTPWPGLADMFYVTVTCVKAKEKVTDIYAILYFHGSSITVNFNEASTIEILAASLGVGAIDRLIAETRGE